MIVSSFLNLFVVPVLYVLVVTVRERIRHVPHVSHPPLRGGRVSGTVRQTADGTIEVVFENGDGKAVRYRLPVDGELSRNGDAGRSTASPTRRSDQRPASVRDLTNCWVRGSSTSWRRSPPRPECC